MKKTIQTFVIGGLWALSASAYSQTLTATYVGPDGGFWGNAANWSTGMVPDENTNVVVEGLTVHVEAGLKVKIVDILVTSLGVVETGEGSTWETRNETLDHGSLIHHSTNAVNTGIGTLTVQDNQSFKLNPTPKSKRIIVLQSSAHMTFGLGGAVGADQTHMGSGTYATLSAEEITLGGTLDLDTYYGFLPTVGQQFQIITSSRSTVGRFAGLDEGAIAGSFNNVDLMISYAGGDGDDVVLTAVPEPSAIIGLLAGIGGFARLRRKKVA